MLPLPPANESDAFANIAGVFDVETEDVRGPVGGQVQRVGHLARVGVHLADPGTRSRSSGCA